MFHEAMAVNTLEQIPAILNAYDFSPINTLVDIGGGNGVLIAALLRAYPDMRGILFDQVAVSRARRTSPGGERRCGPGECDVEWGLVWRASEIR